jgi:RNA polymerase sigma-70 factor, ECF subfamily
MISRFILIYQNGICMHFFSASLKKQTALLRPEDFAQFYEQAHLSVFRYVMVLCAGNQAEAEDISAEAFFRAWEKRGQFSGSASAALGWVIAIARNILIDQRRAESAHPVDANLDEEVSEPGGSIETILMDVEQLQQVLDALQSLPFAQRNMLTLRYVLGWQVKAIAAHLGLAENTVSANLRRALAKLQARLVLQEFQAGRTA